MTSVLLFIFTQQSVYFMKRDTLGVIVCIMAVISAAVVVGLTYNQTDADIIFEDSHLEYKVLDEEKKEVELTKSKTRTHIEDLVIPSKVTYKEVEYTVVSIGSNAFQENNMYSLTLPPTLKKIKSYAFLDALFTRDKQIIIPEGVTDVGYQAFSRSDVESVKLPSTLTSLGNAFSNCYLLKSVDMQEGLTVLGSAFTNCRLLETVSLPSTITSIHGAFTGCEQLRYIYIPENVREIGWTNAFSGSNLQFIDVSPDNPYFKVVDNLVLSKDGTTLLFCPTASKTATVPDGVETLGLSKGETWAFSKCRNLTSVTLPDSLKIINESAFEDCRKLSKITFPDSVTFIGRNAFRNCESMTFEKLPSELKIIDAGAFECCFSIDRFHLPIGLESIGRGAFTGCTALTNLEIPDTVTEVGATAFSNCSNLRGIRLPDGLSVINERTFYGCNSLRSIVIPDGVITVEREAFYGCKALTSIEFPTTLEIFRDPYSAFTFFDADGKKITDNNNLKGHIFVGKDYNFRDNGLSYTDGYTIIFKVDDETIQSSFVKAGDSVTPPEITTIRSADGMQRAFVGWDADVETIPTKDAVYIAQTGDYVNYEVLYQWHDGSKTVSWNGYKHPTIDVAPSDFTENGYTYTFNEWEEQWDSVNDDDYGKFVIATYKLAGVKVVFLANGGTGIMDSTFVKAGDSLTIPQNTFTKDGATFKGWAYSDFIFDDKGTIPATVFEDSYNTIYLIAQWSQSGKVKVTLEVCGPEHDGYYQKIEKIEKEGNPGDEYQFMLSTKTHYHINDGELISGLFPDHDITIRVYYVSDSFTVTAGGKVIAYLSYASDPYVPEPLSDTTGYTFEGWYYDAERTERITSISKLTKDIIIYSNFVPREVTMYFDAAGGTGTMDPISFTAGDTVPAPACEFTREGMRFIHWELDSVSYNPGVDIGKVPLYSSASDFTLTAVWEPVEKFTYTVDFVGPEGDESFPGMDSIVEEYMPGVKVDAVSRFKLDDITGYVADCYEVESFVMPNHDVTFKVYYVKADSEYKKFNINYNMYSCFDGNKESFSKYEYISNHIERYIVGLRSNSALPEMMAVGHTFEGWYSDSDMTNRVTTIDTSIANDQIFYGKFVPNTYSVKVTYIGPTDGSFVAPSEVNRTFVYGQKDFSIVSPKVDGYYPDLQAYTETEVAHDVHIIVTYVSVDWNIRYYSNGGYNNLDNIPDITNTGEFTLLVPSRDGYVFQGWFTDDKYTNKIEKIEKGQLGNIRLYAKWALDAPSHTVTVKFTGPDDGSFVAPRDIEQIVVEGQSYSINVPVIDGYTPDKTIVEGVMGTEAVIVTVTYSANKHTVTIDAGFDIEAIEGWTSIGGNRFTKEFAFNSDLVLPEFTREGFDYVWNPEVPEKMPDFDPSFEAKWSAKKITVTFYPNTRDDPWSEPIDYGGTVEKPTDPVLEGHRFLGWYVFETKELFDFSTKLTQDIKLDAHWATLHTIIFIEEGAKEPISEITACSGDPLTPPEIKAREGYIAKWTPAVPSVVPNEDTTYTLSWEAIPQKPVVDIGTDTPVSGEDLKKMSEDKSSLEVSNDEGSILLGPGILGKLSEDNDSITIKLSKAGSGSMNDKQKQAVGDNDAFDIVGVGKGFDDFGGEKAVVKLKYTLPAGLDPSKICVYYVDDEGVKHEMPTSYDKDTGIIEFETPHFSIYMIGEKEVSPAEDNTIMIVGIVAAVIVIAAVGAFVFLRKH